MNVHILLGRHGSSNFFLFMRYIHYKHGTIRKIKIYIDKNKTLISGMKSIYLFNPADAQNKKNKKVKKKMRSENLKMGIGVWGVIKSKFNFHKEKRFDNFIYKIVDLRTN